MRGEHLAVLERPRCRTGLTAAHLPLRHPENNGEVTLRLPGLEHHRRDRRPQPAAQRTHHPHTLPE
ncbi:putative acyltransferase [Streptomyces sp. Tu6071]|nr:putative acyltransferase [Streptomyces sp. Tu6071]